MSLVSIDAPNLHTSMSDMRNFTNFIYKNELLLKQYGAIKICPPSEFKRVLKKNRMKFILPSTMQQVTQLNQENKTAL